MQIAIINPGNFQKPESLLKIGALIKLKYAKNYRVYESIKQRRK